ncbi:MAG: hypothetical protein JW776_09450 [Candidatus Lokiarchaeota archaeon]|nr:hypothetical protein [Candidatus Lokiarchaeota archaeon]
MPKTGKIQALGITSIILSSYSLLSLFSVVIVGLYIGLYEFGLILASILAIILGLIGLLLAFFCGKIAEKENFGQKLHKIARILGLIAAILPWALIIIALIIVLTIYILLVTGVVHMDLF